MTTCPVCSADQPDGLLCHNDTTRLEQQLRAVPELVAELATTASKQARIGNPGKGGLARERTPVNWGAVQATDNLTNVLTTWARDVSDGTWAYSASVRPAAVSASVNLSVNINIIRRHPAVAELVDEITDAIQQARQAIDRPGERVFLGTCLAPTRDEYDQEQPCDGEVYAKPEASHTTCKTCGLTHEVAERRRWLLEQARHRLYTVPEASRLIGQYGERKVTQQWIWNQIHQRQRLAYRPGTTTLLLGDLLDLLTDDRIQEVSVTPA